MIIGAQLYTLRNFCKTLEDLENTIRRVAEMGYTSVQLSGVCEFDPVWMRDLLAKYNLIAPLTHTPYARIVGDTDRVIEEHKIYGAEYVGLGSMPDFKKSGCDLAVYEKYCEEIAPAVEKIAAAGLKFMYHNHNMEFMKLSDGRVLLEDMAERFPAEKYGITLDFYWVQAGGADPAEWLRKLSGRVDCVHFKDMVYSGEDKAVRMAPVGDGNINHSTIFAAAAEAGVKHAFVEQDHCYGADEFDCMRRSLEFLRGAGY